ncbi:carotenoid ester lipase precursor [Abortiporus biennis]|nr:carotenoid ester lipase precursor [Abortiporus biennis]
MRFSAMVALAVTKALYIGFALAAPTANAPTVTLDQGTFQGATDGTINRFLGIPFAKPPVGDLRFRLPIANDPYNGTQTVTSFGAACPQQSINLPLPDGIVTDAIDFIVNDVYNIITPSSEDCLNLNVWVPAGLKAGTKLPVVAWIFGGGFEIGAPNIYEGGVVVSRSIALGEPIIYVSMNYRVSAFGFLPGQQVKDAGVGNLGLQDQRQALRWIQKYIGAFGGDPTKVTIWGESAGAISVSLHMLANGGNTEGLFRGAFMESGSPIPVGDITNGQKYYDALVTGTGCSGASDTLQCLRQVSYTKLKAAVDASPGIFSPQSLSLAWLPRADGNFLTANPQAMVSQGSVATVPFVTGDCDDEGTLFALSSLNVTNQAALKTYLKTFFLPTATDADVNKLLSVYPDDITQGSPFDTGILNALTPEFKRVAAILGDLVFQAPRRYFLQQRGGKQNAWAFLSKRLKLIPFLGSLHASDLLNVYTAGDLTDYVIHFVNYLDPNGSSGSSWPKYDPSSSSPKLMTFLDGLIPRTISADTYRKDAMDFVTTLSLSNPM